MRAYPLIRRKWSNEHIMAALFGVLLLYLVPQWVRDPKEILYFSAVLAASLLIDAAAGFIKYRRLVCSVSAAVTAGILQILTPGVPLWVRLVGIAAAILAGKVVWGGTGKNTLNPAIVGFLTVYFLSGTGFAPIEPSIFLIPALVLSLPFILFRPFASVGFISGLILSVLFNEPSIGVTTILANCLFFGSIVMTDPVTVTPLKVPGFAVAFVVGFLPLLTGNPALNLILAILIFNLASYLINDFSCKPVKRSNHSGPVLKSITGGIDYGKEAIDLTGADKSSVFDPKSDEVGEDTSIAVLETLEPNQILERIRENGVYGCGGAAFPTADKLNAIRLSDAVTKYLIINGIECDPGLIHDKWLLHNYSEEISKGIKAVCRCSGIDEVFLAVKDPTGLKFQDGIRISTVRNYYPAGYEKFLIANVLGKKLPDGAIPSKEGILVLNVQTLLLIYETVLLNRKCTAKYITVSDLREGKASVVKVNTGSSIMSVSEAVYPEKRPVFTGGGAMQAQMADDDSLIGSETNLIAVSDMPRYKESPFCSGCGICTDNCPAGLRVSRIASLVDEDKTAETVKYSPEKCIRCGLCSYVCPAGRNLSARVGEAKTAVASMA